MQDKQPIDPAFPIRLITARQADTDIQPEMSGNSENLHISRCHLSGGENTAERVIDMRVNSGVINQQVGFTIFLHDIRQSLQPGVGRGPRFDPLAAEAIMPDISQSEAADNVIRAIAVMTVEVQNGYW
jgi:hypothetical protein